MTRRRLRRFLLALGLVAALGAAPACTPSTCTVVGGATSVCS